MNTTKSESIQTGPGSSPSMKIHHLMVVSTVSPQPHDVLRVQYNNYVVEAEDLGAALGVLKEQSAYVDITVAPEVWGRTLNRTTGSVLASPHNPMQTQVDLVHHQHWVNVQEQYTLLHRGPESLTQWATQAFDNHFQDRQSALQPDLVTEGSINTFLRLHPDGAYLIQYDDKERDVEIFARAGARDAALRRFEQVSEQWNAHLFVKVASNTRDETTPNAIEASQPEA